MRKYTITLDHVRQVAAKMGRSAESADASMAAWISDFLMKARTGEMERVHAKVTDAIERELFAQAIHRPTATRPKRPAGWAFPD